jgi:mono/diheme cytochrome c family protein
MEEGANRTEKFSSIEAAPSAKGLRSLPLCHEKIIPVILRPKYFHFSFILLFAVSAATPAHALMGSNTKAAEEAGAVLFRDKGCAYCHGVGGAGGKKAPALIGLRTDKLWTPEKITSQIMNGGQKMPPFSDSLTDAEIAELVAYLRAKNRPVPPPAATPAPPPGL